MASVFEDVHLTWDGRDYVIPSTKVMGAIARIEDVITFAELYQHGQRQSVPLAKLAMAFGSVLRYAGARVEDDEVYAGMFDGEAQEAAATAIQTLMMMMVPPKALERARGEAPQSHPPKPASSKARTKRRSGTGASGPAISG